MDWQTRMTDWGFNPAFWIGTFIGVVGLAMAWKMRSVSRMAYYCRHSSIIGEEQTKYTSDLHVTFKGREIERATLTQLYVWNDGNQTIRREDITKKKPLGFAVPGGQFLLRMTVAQMADEAMDVTFTDGDEASFNVEFEYIEPRQGFVCDILHTGKPEDFEFFGTLIKVREPVRKPLPIPKISAQFIFSTILLLVAYPLSSLEMIGILNLPGTGPVAYIIGRVVLVGGMIASLFTAYIMIKSQFATVFFGGPSPPDNSVTELAEQ
ncbi:hypothetical protein [Agrobacterium fabrum]|uniref:Uncharacterized protein n=2 Tax=Agrobacterium fabrum TaxID=1176649 RepID=A0A7Z7FSA3_9HYPH|nr:hypothetical protein [Agrobacterium fabrum]MCR6727602.1 hypothetical protein [Agrobacterium fabrum]WIE30729.1 hypothetical protein G6L42_024405 [Agrobacterium fabrum]WIE46676.1 hypothetical protein G6L76_024345 [Agrobacterium fabrum]WLP57512.1 hypothetical protein Q8X45_23660 [Agrobacterium fabrum]SDK41208.1 hypothetical protein SAMN05428983_4892 [Agrobacterium fabrum]